MLRKIVWACVFVEIAKSMWREWHMTPMQRFDRNLKRHYIQPMRLLLDKPGIPPTWDWEGRKI